MARPTKEGLDYFPLDVNFDQDDKLVVPMAKFGISGYGIIVRLMSEIYKNSYFYRWGTKEQYVFANRVNVDINLINEIIKECAEWGFFHKELFETYQILTSRGFQTRYIGASKRRKEITFIEEYTLVNLEEEVKKVHFPITLVNVNGNTINVYINRDKASKVSTESTQKEKEIEKEREREKERKKLPRQRIAYAEDSTPYRMAIYFHNKIMAFAESIGKAHLVRDADMQKWADSCRKILELDKRDPNEVRELIDWVTADPFWQQNVLSPDKLREKYTDLAMRMAGGGRSRPRREPAELASKNQQEVNKIKELMQREGSGDSPAVSHHPQHV